jgi:hypothetical protein
MWQADLVYKLMTIAKNEGDEAAAMLYLAAYSFMLRVPSEGLPMVAGGDPLKALEQGTHSAIAVVGSEIILSLARRKNLPGGSTMRRDCTCNKSRQMCPVHVLGPWFQDLAGKGKKPFIHYSPCFARSELKRRAELAGCSDSKLYTLHDLRRGHAQNIIENGGNLQHILSAGQWSSNAFLVYLDKCKLDKNAVAEAQVFESDSDGE